MYFLIRGSGQRREEGQTKAALAFAWALAPALMDLKTASPSKTAAVQIRLIKINGLISAEKDYI